MESLRNIHNIFLGKREDNHLKHLGVDERIALIEDLKKYGVRV
jgi:hypothetical protein